MKKLLLLIAIFTTGVFQMNAQIDGSKFILHLKFDDNLNDSSGNNIAFNYSANSTNPIAYETGAPFTGSGKSGYLNQSVYVSTTDGFFDHVNEHTVAAWVKLDQLPSAGEGLTLLHQQDVTGQNPGRIHLEAIFAGDVFSSLSTNARASDTTPLVIDTWYHIASVVDRTTGNHIFYVNGVNVDSVIAGFESNNGALVLGAFKNEMRLYFYGNVDDLLITSEALSKTQIDNLIADGVEASTLGINDISKEDASVKVFVSKEKVLTYETPSKVSKSEIYNITGQKLISVEKAENNKINVNKLSTGVYILRLEAEDKVSTKKFVIK